MKQHTFFCLRHRKPRPMGVDSLLMLFLFLLLLAFFFNGFCRLLFHILFGVSWLSHFFPPV